MRSFVDASRGAESPRGFSAQRFTNFALLFVLGFGAVIGPPACGTNSGGEGQGGSGASSGEGGSGGAEGGSGGSQGGQAGEGGSECIVEGDTLHESLGGAHVISNEGVVYNSNPPSSGSHCPEWATWEIFSEEKPLSDCHYLHNLEHGGIVLVYNCPDGCSSIVKKLKALRDVADDPDCDAARVIITPDPKLDVTVAATAWQRTWRADCLDDAAEASLAAFMHDNIGSRGLSVEATLCGAGAIRPE